MDRRAKFPARRPCDRRVVSSMRATDGRRLDRRRFSATGLLRRPRAQARRGGAAAVTTRVHLPNSAAPMPISHSRREGL
jgi:hypothetical protein